MKHPKKLIIIYGPTGVGKTDLSFELDKLTPIEIINGDMGQFYEPFSIGTAKPDWKHEAIPHHLFDYCTTPQDMTVVQYRKLILEKTEEIWARGATPVIVGGSGFYIKSLFFPPKESFGKSDQPGHEIVGANYEHKETEALWNMLYQHDPKRAEALELDDRYRIMRALDIVNSGLKPSELAPEYVPFAADVLVLFLSRPREQLYARINERTEIMMKAGWMEEIKSLLGTPWEEFLLRKKIIGYNDGIEYVRHSDCSDEQYQLLISTIQKKTRNYAKRQCTFWRMLQKLLGANFTYPSKAAEIDLTVVEQEQLGKLVTSWIKGH